MWLLGAVFVLMAVWFHRRLNKMSILIRNGIPGNRPHLIFGNLFEMKSLSMVERHKRLIEKFGKIVGYYTGTKPIVLVADPELVKNIQIKDFNNFTDRSAYMRYFHPTSKNSGGLVFVQGQRWKQIRSLLSPAFSASKLKTMTPILNDSVNLFLKIIDKKAETEEEFNIYELYQKLTVEMIIKSAFGVEIDAQNDPNNELVKTVHKYLESKVNKLVFLLFVCFPELEHIIQWLREMNERICTALNIYPTSLMYSVCSKIIKLRKESPDLQRKDILQAMLDSELSDEDMSDMMNERLTASYKGTDDLVSNYSQNNVKPPKTSKCGNHLTENEIIVNCVVFLGAGYDTSSTGLAYATHVLVNYPDVQEMVRQEVIELYESEGKLDFNVVTKLQYLEWVLNETMRLYPPLANGSTRECLADYKYKNIIIPKGATVAMCTHFLHHDPDYWHEPANFDPMRFSPERRHEINPGSWQAFGGGPRNCIGMRLAYLKMKLTLARLLLNYRIEPGPNTEIGGLMTKYKLLSVAPKNGVFVKVSKI